MLYTLGYRSVNTVDAAVRLAKDRNAVLVDIRLSGRGRGFHESTFKRICESVGVKFIRAEGLGNLNYQEAGKPIVLKDPEPCYHELVDLLNAGKNVVIMCACPSYLECHRRVVADELVKRTRVEVEHINPSMAKETRGKAPTLWKS